MLAKATPMPAPIAVQAARLPVAEPIAIPAPIPIATAAPAVKVLVDDPTDRDPLYRLFLFSPKESVGTGQILVILLMLPFILYAVDFPSKE